MKWLPTPARYLTAIVAVAALALVPAVRAQELQTIELRHRLAEEILPVVQPLLEEGGVLTGVDGVLFVRTSPANLQQILQAVAAIDRAPRQLLITVGQGTVARSANASAEGAVVLGSESAGRIEAHGGTRQADLRNVSSIRTLEGSETYIAVGQSAAYRSTATGFYATARMSGDTVTLEVSPQQQRLTGHRQAIRTSGAASVVSARLGEWVELGAVRDTSSGSTAGLLVWGRHSAASEYSAWVKVDEVR